MPSIRKICNTVVIRSEKRQLSMGMGYDYSKHQCLTTALLEDEIVKGQAKLIKS